MVFVFNLQSYNKFLKLQKNKNAVSICLNKESKKQKRSFVKIKQRLTSVFLYIRKSIPYFSPQILMVLSNEPLIIFVQSGLNATE